MSYNLELKINYINGITLTAFKFEERNKSESRLKHTSFYWHESASGEHVETPT